MKIYNVYYVILLKQNTTQKKQVKKVIKLSVSNKDSKKYKIEAIWDNAVYVRKSKGHLLGFYYIVIRKVYLKKRPKSQR